MNTAKVLEVITEGQSIEGALENAVADASKTIRGIKSIYAESINAKVEDGKITSYRVNAKITFLLD